MQYVGLSLSSLLGLGLMLLGVVLPVLGLIAILRNPRTTTNVIGLAQDIALGLAYIMAGFILFFQGWRQDPLLQFGQLLLTGTTVYLSLKDLFLRFRR